MTESWRPTSPAIDPQDLPALGESEPCLVVHVWTGGDERERTIDDRLEPIREEFAGRVAFRSMDARSPGAEDVYHAWRLTAADLPVLVCFTRGRYRGLATAVYPTKALRVLVSGLLVGDHRNLVRDPRPAETFARQVCLVGGFLSACLGAFLLLVCWTYAGMAARGIEPENRDVEFWRNLFHTPEFHVSLLMIVPGVWLWFRGLLRPSAKPDAARTETV
jgi:hypothetical protein